MLDQLRGSLWLEANAGVGKDGAMSAADQVSAREARLIAGDFDVSPHDHILSHALRQSREYR
jgi:hypothetical protein